MFFICYFRKTFSYFFCLSWSIPKRYKIFTHHQFIIIKHSKCIKHVKIAFIKNQDNNDSYDFFSLTMVCCRKVEKNYNYTCISFWWKNLHNSYCHYDLLKLTIIKPNRLYMIQLRMRSHSWPQDMDWRGIDLHALAWSLACLINIYRLQAMLLYWYSNRGAQKFNLQ